MRISFNRAQLVIAVSILLLVASTTLSSVEAPRFLSLALDVLAIAGGVAGLFFYRASRKN